MHLEKIKQSIIDKFKGFKKISESSDAILFQCIKCASNLKVRKQYGEVNVVCTCGFSFKVDTGKDIHSIQAAHREEKMQSEVESEIARKNRERNKIFNQNIISDLRLLQNMVLERGDILRQINKKECINLLDGMETKRSFEKVVRFLQTFLNLGNVPIKIVWKPLVNQNGALCDINKEISILGTTYVIPMNRFIFYTIYLNPTQDISRDVRFATIAHELSHIYASYHRIRFVSPNLDRGDLEYSEQLTDLLGIVLGMGGIMCYSSDERESHNIGYLTRDMVCEAFRIWKSEILPPQHRLR